MLTTYEGLRAGREHLLDVRWGYAVLDEGHKIRNPDTEVTLVAKQLPTLHRWVGQRMFSIDTDSSWIMLVRTQCCIRCTFLVCSSGSERLIAAAHFRKGLYQACLSWRSGHEGVQGTRAVARESVVPEAVLFTFEPFNSRVLM